MKKLGLLSLLVLSACSSSGPKYKVDDSLVEALPVAQQQRISRIGLGREDAKEQREKALAFQGKAYDALDRAKEDFKNAKKGLALAEAQVDAAEARQELQDANVRLAKEQTDAAEQNLKLSLINFELEKAKAVQATGAKSSVEIGLVQFEKESYDAQRQLTEINLRTVKQQERVSSLEKELTEKTEKVQDLRD